MENLSQGSSKDVKILQVLSQKNLQEKQKVLKTAADLNCVRVLWVHTFSTVQEINVFQAPAFKTEVPNLFRTASADTTTTVHFGLAGILGSKKKSF